MTGFVQLVKFFRLGSVLSLIAECVTVIIWQVGCVGVVLGIEETALGFLRGRFWYWYRG